MGKIKGNGSFIILIFFWGGVLFALTLQTDLLDANGRCTLLSERIHYKIDE